MTTIEKAQELRTQAINLLLEERAAIDDELALLGYEKTAPKRGRPPKKPIQPDEANLSARSDTTA